MVGVLGCFRCITPWAAARSRLCATGVIGCGASAGLYLWSDGTAKAYPPQRTDLTGSIIAFTSLLAMNGLLAPRIRVLAHGWIMDANSRIVRELETCAGRVV